MTTNIEDIQKQITKLTIEREQIKAEIERLLEPLEIRLHKTNRAIEEFEKYVGVMQLAEHGLKIGDKLLCTDRYKTYSNAVARRFMPFDYALVRSADYSEKRVWIDAYHNGRDLASWGHVVPVDIVKGMRQAWIQEHGDE